MLKITEHMSHKKISGFHTWNLNMLQNVVLSSKLKAWDTKDSSRKMDRLFSQLHNYCVTTWFYVLCVFYYELILYIYF